MFYYFLKIFIAPIVSLVWVKKITGKDNIPKKGGVIIAANHESYFDFITLYSIVPRPMHFLAGEVFFKKKQWAWLMKLTKQIKVDRETKDKSESLRYAISYLKDGKIIGIFPEGTRSSDGKLQKAYNGAVKLAIESGVPIVPVGIKGTYEIMSRHDKYPGFKKCTLAFGEPIFFNKDSADLTTQTNMLMNKIGDLCGEVYNF